MGDRILRLLDKIANWFWKLPSSFRVFGSFLVYVGLPLALVYAVAMDGYLFFTQAQTNQPILVIGSYERAPGPPATTTVATTAQDLFKDVLTYGLIVAGMVIAIGSFFGIEWVRALIETGVARAANTKSRRAIASSLTTIGYHYWLQYEHTKDLFSLQQPIDITKRAYNDHASQLDDKDREMEGLIAAIRNNLASYIATLKARRGSVGGEDRSLAEGCARYIKARIHKYPAEAATWEHTLGEVRESFPECPTIEQGGLVVGQSSCHTAIMESLGSLSSSAQCPNMFNASTSSTA